MAKTPDQIRKEAILWAADIAENYSVGPMHDGIPVLIAEQIRHQAGTPTPPAPIAAQTEKCPATFSAIGCCLSYRHHGLHRSDGGTVWGSISAEQVDAARLVDQFRDAVLGMSSAEEYDRIREKLIASFKQEIPAATKCLCIVGCSVNGLCPIHGDAVKNPDSHLGAVCD